jgi:hypothetical protein
VIDWSNIRDANQKVKVRVICREEVYPQGQINLNADYLMADLNTDFLFTSL